MKEFIKIHSEDLVAVALTPLSAGTVIRLEHQDLTLSEDIPQGHKFALADIPAGKPIIKYGAPIGIATKSIPAGSWVHTHNMKTGLGDLLDYTYSPQNPPVVPTDDRYFQGYRRANGTVGVRNEIWIIPTVSCVNNISSAIEAQAQELLTGHIDSIAAFPHPYGCSQMGDDQENTRTILADLINHPNAGGVLVLGLGCENSNIDVLKPYIGEYDPKRVKFLVCQEHEDEIADALKLVKELVQYADQSRREPISCSELIIGMKCGGSDGLSGITANPTVGAFSDLLISKGGTTILTEVPEMFGAETLLMNRCENERVFSQLVDRIVTGYPRGEADSINEANGYIDQVLDTGEIFGFWVIEGPQELKKELPFAEAGLPVLITDDHKPYKQRKVRILNGAHTSMVLGAYLAGQDIVRDCMHDDVICGYMNKTIYEEIIPTLTLPRDELMDFAHSVTERFKNPFIDHALLSISLNSTAKWKARVLPSFLGYVEKNQALPKCLTASFAFYIAFYHGVRLEDAGLIGKRSGNEYTIHDDRDILQFYDAHKNDSNAELAHAVMSNTAFWGQDLTEVPGFEAAVVQILDDMETIGSYEVMKNLL